MVPKCLVMPTNTPARFFANINSIIHVKRKEAQLVKPFKIRMMIQATLF